MNTTNQDNPKNKIVWDAESTHPDLIEPFKEAMRQVVDPEIGLNVIELGLIRNLSLSDDFALINMILTTPFCPYGPAMLEMVRKKGEECLQRPTRMEMGMEMWDFSMMEEGVGGDWGIF